MTITDIEYLNGSKNRIYIDGEYAFMLYTRDIGLYGLECPGEISEDKYTQIIKETVLRRAKQKAMAILARFDKTEAELRRKLRTDMYTDAVIDSVIEYLYQFHYLDDIRYAANYIRNNIGSLSRNNLTAKLLQKGVSRENISAAFIQICEEEEDCRETDDEAYNPENEACVNTLRRKLGGKLSIDAEAFRKMLGYMYRKGFFRSDILHAFEILGVNIEGLTGDEDF